MIYEFGARPAIFGEGKIFFPKIKIFFITMHVDEDYYRVIKKNLIVY